MTIRMDPTKSATEMSEIRPDRPRPTARTSLRFPWLFGLVVVLPVAAAATYYLFLAAPIYVSEARFIVRKTSEQQVPATGLTTMLQGMGLAGSDTDAFAVQQYMTSRAAVAVLDQNRALRTMLSRPSSDLIMRFPRPFETDSQENLYRAYGRFVDVGYDATSGVSTLKVLAFQPGDAQSIAQTLIRQGEDLVNRLNQRAEADAVTDARLEVDEAGQRLAQSQAGLTIYRDREGIIDPTRSSAVDLDLVGKLSGELATLRAERAGLAAAAPQSPQLPGLDDRIKAYQQQVDAARGKMAGESGSLASKMARFDQLSLEREFATKALASAVANLDSARQDARRKRLYLQVVVDPGRADSANLPHRWGSLATVLVSALLAYATIILIVAGVREHRQ